MSETIAYPAAFVGHGSPMLALDGGGLGEGLRRFAASLEATAAIVVVSAHWESDLPVRVTAAAHPSLLYDFGGFPEELYSLVYPCPGSPDLAAAIVGRLSKAGISAVADARRGLDHGAWVPLRLGWPEAGIPVVQVSLPHDADPRDLAALGRALAFLRERRVLLLGSGGIVHNLGLVRFPLKDAPVDPWAREFDDWVAVRAERLDLDGLSDYRRAAPHAARAVPTTEHLAPLFVVLGAARNGDRAAPIYVGFEHANLSLRSFALRS